MGVRVSPGVERGSRLHLAGGEDRHGDLIERKTHLVAPKVRARVRARYLYTLIYSYLLSALPALSVPRSIARPRLRGKVLLWCCFAFYQITVFNSGFRIVAFVVSDFALSLSHCRFVPSRRPARWRAGDGPGQGQGQGQMGQRPWVFGHGNATSPGAGGVVRRVVVCGLAGRCRGRRLGWRCLPRLAVEPWPCGAFQAGDTDSGGVRGRGRRFGSIKRRGGARRVTV